MKRSMKTMFFVGGFSIVVLLICLGIFAIPLITSKPRSQNSPSELSTRSQSTTERPLSGKSLIQKNTERENKVQDQTELKSAKENLLKSKLNRLMGLRLGPGLESKRLSALKEIFNTRELHETIQSVYTDPFLAQKLFGLDQAKARVLLLPIFDVALMEGDEHFVLTSLQNLSSSIQSEGGERGRFYDWRDIATSWMKHIGSKRFSEEANHNLEIIGYKPYLKNQLIAAIAQAYRTDSFYKVPAEISLAMKEIKE